MKGIAALAAATTLLAGCVSPVGAGADAPDDEVQQDLARARRATAAYHDADTARAAGYEQVSPCVDGRPKFDGAMGVHFLRHDLLQDPDLDVEQPELLVYFPTDEGLRLVALEWMRIDGDGDLETDDDRPRLFGEPFKGPMPGHGEGEPVHYDLHAWVWQNNPDGTFADWNPKLRCPGA